MIVANNTAQHTGNLLKEKILGVLMKQKRVETTALAKKFLWFFK